MSPVDAAETDSIPLNKAALLPSRTGEPLAPFRNAPIFGLPDEAFDHQEGLITKAEIRAVVIAQLALKPGLVLWDIGAGSGSVSIEAARIASLRLVFAVEKHPDRYGDLCRNIDRFQCSAIQAIQSGAAEVLVRLEDPDRVFIGGGGKDLEKILMVSSARLRPGGLIVMTAVTLDSLDVMRNFWSNRPFRVLITQIQASRSVPIGKSVRMEALNPVFVLRVSRIQK